MPSGLASTSAAWSVPKGEPRADEEPLTAAVHEFAEELGCPGCPQAPIETRQWPRPARVVAVLDPRG